MAAIRNVDTWGDGWFLGTQEYTAVEWHPDTERFHDIARMTFRMTVDSLPPVCPVDPKHETVGKHTTYESYFQVDRKRKVMQLIGSKYVGNEGPFEIHDFFQVTGNNPDTRGGWTFFRRDEEAVQYILNANNNVLREVDYARSPTSVYAGSDNVKFNVIANQQHHVAPDIEGVPCPAELVDDKLREIKKYILANDSMYYNPTVDGTERHVDVVAEFNQVTAVDTPHNRFFASLAITFKWKITKDDVVAYIITPDQDTWEPQFAPPIFTVKNNATGDGAAIMTSKYSSIVKKKEKFKGEKSWIAKQTLTIEGDFYEQFELENYPFDIQPLAVVLESRGNDTVAFECKWSGTTEEGLDLHAFHDTEWSGTSGETCHEFIQDEDDEPEISSLAAAIKGVIAVNRLTGESPKRTRAGSSAGGAGIFSNRRASMSTLENRRRVSFERARNAKAQPSKMKAAHGLHVLNIEAVAKRSSAVHVYRVFSVMALLSLASIVALCADPNQIINTLDRIGVVFTLMLTATAYSLVIADGLPTLGYLTFIDKYILSSFAFIALVGIEITIIDWVAAKRLTSAGMPLYDADEVFEYAAYVDIGLWFTLHLAFYIYVSRWIIPLEQRGDNHNDTPPSTSGLAYRNVCSYVSTVSKRTCPRLCAPGKKYCSQLHLCLVAAHDCDHQKASKRRSCGNDACEAALQQQDDDDAGRASPTGGDRNSVLPESRASEPDTPAHANTNGNPPPESPKGSSNKVAPVRDDSSEEFRGPCGKCGANVLASQARTHDQGVYYHDVCPK